MPDEKLAVTIQRSRRRKRTISWEIRHGELRILLPAGLPPAEERAWVEKIQERARQRLRRAERATDPELFQRCRELWRLYFPGPCPLVAARWSDRQERIHGSCTTATAEIRVSTRLLKFPGWVLDYILVHELAHLLEPSHNRRFWDLVRQYALAERARGFLQACDLGFAGSLAGMLGEMAEPGEE